jgi:radical SAM superfamily enzyme YgiQ (UPF0313 family)
MGIQWSCSTRIDSVNEDLLNIMAEAGCAEIAFGLESGSDNLLCKVKKGWLARRKQP